MRAVDTPAQNKVVSGGESLEARQVKENEFKRLRDELSRQRFDLPGPRGEKSDVFVGRQEKETIADLFDGLRQSIVQHIMFSRGSEEGCPSSLSCPIILTAPLFI